MTLVWWFILGFAIVGFCSTVWFFLLICGAACLRPDLDRFNNPNEPKLRKIIPLPWGKR